MAVAWCVGEGEKHGGREHAEVWGATWVHEMEIPVSNCLLAWHQAFPRQPLPVASLRLDPP